jgi:uncharacterized protein YihD (DUF1040 family)
MSMPFGNMMYLVSVFDNIGVKLLNENGCPKSFIEVLDDLSVVWLKLDDHTKNGIVEVLANFER